MTKPNETHPAATEDLNETSLDLVVGGGIIAHDIIMHDVTGGTSFKEPGKIDYPN